MKAAGWVAAGPAGPPTCRPNMQAPHAGPKHAQRAASLQVVWVVHTGAGHQRMLRRIQLLGDGRHLNLTAQHGTAWGRAGAERGMCYTAITSLALAAARGNSVPDERARGSAPACLKCGACSTAFTACTCAGGREERGRGAGRGGGSKELGS